jgi:hypothetical protein
MLLKKSVQIQMKYKVGKHAVISFQQQQRVVQRIQKESCCASRLWPWTWPYGEIVVFGGGDADRRAD